MNETLNMNHRIEIDGIPFPDSAHLMGDYQIFGNKESIYLGITFIRQDKNKKKEGS